jgi:hypothetical protein
MADQQRGRWSPVASPLTLAALLGPACRSGWRPWSARPPGSLRRSRPPATSTRPTGWSAEGCSATLSGTASTAARRPGRATSTSPSSTRPASTRPATPWSWRPLTARLSGVPWDAKNQAAVHTWYGRVFGGQVAPLTSAADGVATWPETATAVAVRLLPDDRLQVVAPCGLEDLFGLICRRNPRRVTVAHYRQRIHDKRITERWPRVEVVL